MNKIEIIVKALSDKLGENIIAIDMREVSPIFDTFIVCTASNERLMQALKDNVEEEMEKNGYVVKRVEGIRKSQWLLMDYGDIIVHIFDEGERNSYNLEKLWGDLPRIDIEDYL
ncbi:MAG: ribosome silencing factor [Beduini sp.]